MTGGPVVEIEIFINAQYGYDVRAELVGEKGTVSLQPRSDTLVRRNGMEGILHGDDWRGRFADAYRIELQAWIDAIAIGGAAGASAWDGYAATAIADASLESSDRQPADVRLRSRRSTAELHPASGLPCGCYLFRPISQIGAPLI
jgi:myo-inositol 2-dehydrogenase/D-chiro-inositol 1-dehydrogenase